ncbi:unnamed protein product [Schistocephalus solidus]|uniref:BTB domain-containing protein n=1 Tax=Schistocephalus solidus TaxID=70667 RepID=A0A183TGR0_SCHSO|nr:unnamed protein product [Schistocephalus solidus]
MPTGRQVSLYHIRQLHAKLYEFYKAEQMTDVTITCAADSTPVRTHAFVCATSGYLADLLAGASGPPYVLALPSMGADRLRVLLDFLYSASLDPTISLTTYLQLASELKVPLLLEASQHALNQKIQTFGFNLESVDAGAAADDLRTIYAYILTNFSEGKLREQTINLFAAHPFAFTCRFFPPVSLPAFALAAECLRLIPPDVFTRVLSSEIATHQDFPSHTWKIGSLRAYVARHWEGRRPLAGFDVVYENIWTGETRECLWNPNGGSSSYTVEEFRVPPGDVIEGVHIRSGWVIDQITFVTRAGLYLGPCGLSAGGNVVELSMKDPRAFALYTAPSPRRSRAMIESESDYEEEGDVESENSESPALSPHSPHPTPALVALHGFKYVNIANQGLVFWNNVRFCYSAITFDALKPKMSIPPAPNVLAKLHFSL